MRLAVIIGMMVVAAGCATQPSPSEVLSLPAPSLTSVNEQINTANTCAAVTPETIRDLTEAGRIYRCAPVFPAAMASAAIAGSCTTMFDLDDDGAPVRAETRCVVDNAKVPAPQSWLDLAEKAYVHSAQLAISQTRYPSRGEGDARPRSNLVQTSIFNIKGGRQCLNPPRKFARPPPAPVPAPFVAEREGPGCPAY